MPLSEPDAEYVKELLFRAGFIDVDENANDQIVDASDQAKWIAWLAKAYQFSTTAVSDPSNIYRRGIEVRAIKTHGMSVGTDVKHAAALLEALRDDLEAGRIGSPADLASAATFDDMLDHAAAYLGDGRHEPAGTLAGVVFEDSARRVYRKVSGEDASGRDLEEVINYLKSKPTTGPVLSGTQAKRAKVAAHVRSKATHAAWDEFSHSDVEETIKFTREFIDKHLATA